MYMDYEKKRYNFITNQKKIRILPPYGLNSADCTETRKLDELHKLENKKN